MKILVDIDGIITDTLPAWLDRIHFHTGVRAKPNEIKKWNLNENPPLDKVVPSKLWSILNEKDFNLSLPEMPNASHNLKLLHEDGHDICIVTARVGDVCVTETFQWLEKMMPWFNHSKVFFCKNKDGISGDVLVDDKAENLIDYQRVHPETKLVTIDYPYNKHVPLDTFRVANNTEAWSKIRVYIQQLAKRK